MTKFLGSLIIAGGLVIAPLSAAELNTEVVPSVAHEIVRQEADLLAIASAGALSASSAGVQLLTADEQDAVKGGLKWKKVRGKIRKVVKEFVPLLPPLLF